MVDLIFSIFSFSFGFVFKLLSMVKLDNISLWSLLIVFIFGAGLIRVLVSHFNPSSAASVAPGLIEDKKSK